MIKANELKKRSVTLKEIEEHLQTLILSANDSGQCTVRTYGLEGIFGDGALYSGNYPPIVQSTLDMLKAHGYKAWIVVEEKQFVDVYLKISWE